MIYIFSVLFSDCLFFFFLFFFFFFQAEDGIRDYKVTGVQTCALPICVDFAILIFGRFQQARIDGQEYQQSIATAVSKLGRAVFFGALTTAVGFLALILSGSMGFSQLGVLIAIGIFFAGLFMCTILFLFV